jgi:transposase
VRLWRAEDRCARIRERLAAAAAIAEVTPAEGGAAVLIQGSNATPRTARQVRRAQRRVSKRTKRGHSHSHRQRKAVGSRVRTKQGGTPTPGPHAGTYAAAKERERDVRKHHRHIVTRALVDGFGEISVRDLDVKALTVAPENDPNPEPELPAGVRRRVNRAFLDGAPGAFGVVLGYKAADAGVAVVTKPTPYSAMTCSRCGALVRKSPSQRVHRCPQCGYVAPRAVNTSRNVANVATDDSTVLQPDLEQPGRAGPSGGKRRGLPHALA